MKQSLFADDVTYINDGSKTTFETLIKTIKSFGQISGLKLNTSKSTILRVGTLKTSRISFLDENNYQNDKCEAKTLGILFNRNSENMFENNFLPKLQSFKNCLKSWHHRN